MSDAADQGRDSVSDAPSQPASDSASDSVSEPAPQPAAEQTVPLPAAGPGASWRPPAPEAPGAPGAPRPGPAWQPPGPAYPTMAMPRPVVLQPVGRVPLWLWPVTAALALVIGLFGGTLGGVAYEQWRASGGGNSRGLDGVVTRSEAPLPIDNGSVASVARELLPSTVQVLVAGQGEGGGATGSGFVLDTDGHIVTNSHVVAGAANGGPIEVVDTEGNRLSAKLVGRSSVYDLAVLSVSEADSLRPAALGVSESLNIGEGVVAIGSPLGLSSTVTAGIVSALNRPVSTGDSEDETSYINAVQTDAAINPGNSGGPLVNLRGQVVGVNSAIATTGGSLSGESGNIGVGFAIPIEQVRVTADQILRTGQARYPVIGATVRTAGGGSGLGAVIEDVQAGTPAAEAGLRRDDLVTEIDGDRVTDGIALIVMIRTHLPGETVRFTVERDGQERQVSVVLGSKIG